MRNGADRRRGFFFAPTVGGLRKPAVNFLRVKRERWCSLRAFEFSESLCNVSQRLLGSPSDQRWLCFLSQHAGHRRLEQLVYYAVHADHISVAAFVEMYRGAALVDFRYACVGHLRLLLLRWLWRCCAGVAH